MTGLKVLKGLKKSHNEWLSGANELDLVKSGIEFSMIEVLENVFQI